MTQIVHIANTHVEFEFAHPFDFHQTLEQSLSRHPLCLQLQFLPLLIANPHDIVAVTSLPPNQYTSFLLQTGWWPQGLPQMIPLQEIEPFYGKHCQSWGPSRQVQAWAEARRMTYNMPKDWPAVCLINSKAFSFRYTSLKEAALINNEQELLDWLQKIEGAKVLKTCFGLSGKGHRHIRESAASPEILAFCQKEWQQGRPVIAEPWLDRICDFSTQWYIHPNQQIEFIGATRFETDPYGIYQGTFAGPEETLFASLEVFLEQHRQIVRKALIDIAAMGIFGFIGIDALLYLHPQTGSICLYPLVEINGRQTMSLVALRLQQRLFPHRIFHLSFKQNDSDELSLLPINLVDQKGKIIPFQKRLIGSFLPPGIHL